MKLHRLLALLAVLAVLGCSKEEPQPPTTPTTANSQAYPGMQGSGFRIPPRGAAPQVGGGK
jgi:hypothetical protein